MLKVNINIIFTVINVIIIYIVLSKFMFKKMEAKFAKRAAAIDKEFETAALKQKEADLLNAEYKEKVASIGTEKEEVMREARAQADEEARQIKEAASNEAEAIRTSAQDTAEAQKDQILRRAEQEVADMVMQAAQKAVGGQKGAKVDGALYDDFLNKAGDKE